ncbi:hypothetical protein, partial [Luteolibacter pohnpeiensis]|uniref:hypothetical protein n=1 Tax=Luteolibacter pohnpeiensis TaxID=454153 RepID=UPI001F281A15
SASPITNPEVIPAANIKVKLPNQLYLFLSRTFEATRPPGARDGSPRSYQTTQNRQLRCG